MSGHLLTDEFWNSDENAVCLPGHAPLPPQIIDRALQELGIGGMVVFQTSGTSGDPSYVCHSRSGLLASANAVNAHIRSLADDVWVCVLPTFHVGGLGVYARGYCSKSKVYAMGSAWDPHRFRECCVQNGATLSSLVPTQVFDLVRAGIPSPPSLRAVLVGGGLLDEKLEAQARALSWPVLRTYGLTEAASQVATQGADELLVLPHLDALVGEGGRLKLRGTSLLCGYLRRDAGGVWGFEDPKTEGGWFQTDDRVELDGRALRFLGRLSSRVKVLGELVDIDVLERGFLATLPPGSQAAITAVPDERLENALVVAFVGNLDRHWLEAQIHTFNASLAGFERLVRATRLGAIPRSELGKIRRDELRRLTIEAEK